MKKRLLLLFLFFALFFSGCQKDPAPKETAPLCHVVTRAEVVLHQGDTVLRKTFTQDSKIRSVLQYLRLLEYTGDTAEPTPREGSPLYIFTFHYSDGSRHTLQQQGWDYIRRDDGPWQVLHPSRSRNIIPLFRLLPGDD